MLNKVKAGLVVMMSVGSVAFAATGVIDKKNGNMRLAYGLLSVAAAGLAYKGLKEVF